MPRSFLNTTGLPIGLRNNNPGNIRPGDNWRGMIGTNGGFVVFENILWGLRALGKDITTKHANGYNTITKLITRYAPPTENNTPAYIQSVSSFTGIAPNTVINLNANTLAAIIRAILNVELGSRYSAMIYDNEISEAIQMIGNPDLYAAGAAGAGVIVLGLAAWLFYDQVIKQRQT